MCSKIIGLIFFGVQWSNLTESLWSFQYWLLHQRVIELIFSNTSDNTSTDSWSQHAAQILEKTEKVCFCSKIQAPSLVLRFNSHMSAAAENVAFLPGSIPLTPWLHTPLTHMLHCRWEDSCGPNTFPDPVWSLGLIPPISTVQWSSSSAT